MIDLAHIHPEFRHVLGMSDKDRMAFLDEPRWIGYAQANRLLDNLRGLMEKPMRPRMPNLLTDVKGIRAIVKYPTKFSSEYGRSVLIVVYFHALRLR